MNMKTTIFRISVWLFLILFTSGSQRLGAQQDSLVNQTIAFHPFHLVNNGIRIDYDRKIGKNQWIQLGPQFYASEKTEDQSLYQNSDYRNYKSLIGIGISVYHRIYLGSKQAPFGTYFSYGITYNHFKLGYSDDNQNTTAADAETRIQKLGADIVIGYQLLAFEKMIIDLYAGLGGRYAVRSYTGTKHTAFNEWMYDYGYTGNVMLVGIRIGIGF
jgi:hypothetical protein